MVASAIDSDLPLASFYPAGAVVSRDLKCVGCAYNLRTLPVDSRCPECGLNVERSLLVLPQRDRTAAAIRLAAWGLLLSVLLGCLGPLSLVGFVLMLAAAYRLHYRCELPHMTDLGRRVRWWWMTLVVGTIGGTLLAIVRTGLVGAALAAGSPLSTAISAPLMRVPTAGRPALAQHTSPGSAQLMTNALGQQILLILDPGGTVLSTTVLTSRTLWVLDANRQALQVRVDEAGIVTLHFRGLKTMILTPGVPVTFATASVAIQQVILLIFGGVFALIGFIAPILYLLMCRSLAIRANDTGLARQFRTLLWLLVLGMGARFMEGFAGTTLVSFASAGRSVLIWSTLVATVCLLIVGIWQIVASFRLAAALREAPLHWSEIVAVPGEAGIVIRDS